MKDIEGLIEELEKQRKIKPKRTTMFKPIKDKQLTFLEPDTNLTEDPVVNSVIGRMATRSNGGMRKFGISMRDNQADALFWLRSLQEELLDGAVYLEKLAEVLEETQELDGLDDPRIVERLG